MSRIFTICKISQDKDRRRAGKYMSRICRIFTIYTIILDVGGSDASNAPWPVQNGAGLSET